MSNTMHSMTKLCLVVFLTLFLPSLSYAQCGNTQLGGQSGCTRSNDYYGVILPNAGCGVDAVVNNYPVGKYFRIPVLRGACYQIGTCGSTDDMHINCFQGNNTTGPFAYDDDNGPLCTGVAPSLNMSPNFSDYAAVDIRLYACLTGVSKTTTLTVKQVNNLSFTSSGADMCAGATRQLTATPEPVGSAQPSSGSLGTFSGLGVSGSVFTAPTPAGNSAVYTLTYSFGYCSTTQSITVYKAPSAAAAGPDQTVGASSTTLAAVAPGVGTGTWSLVSGSGNFANPNSSTTVVTNLGVGANIFRWTVSNGPCTGSSDDVTITYIPCPVGTIYVNAIATGANTGTSWADAYTSLQSALANTCPGITQIWVAAGTYKPTTGTDRSISFSMKNGVSILGGFPNNDNTADLNDRNWETNVTILSGDIGTVGNNTDNSLRVIANSGLNSSAVLDGFTIRDAFNTSQFNGNQGGGMRNDNASPTIVNCVFRNNSIASYGGGVYNLNSSPTFTNCLFTANSALGGGAMGTQDGNPVLINCTLTGNNVDIRGAPLDINAFSVTASNTLRNCIVWGNTGPSNSPLSQIGAGAAYTVTYSIVQGGYAGTGNLDIDPLFVNAAGGDFHLQACSPAIDAGLDADNATTRDLSGNPRLYQAVSGGEAIDMGAYEYQQAAALPVALCKTFTADLDANGVVTVSASDINDGSTAPCSATLSINGQSSVSYTCSDIGPKTATLTVTSAQNNRSATCNTTITVRDVTPPKIFCPENHMGFVGANCVASLTNYAVSLSFQDNCGSSSNTQTPPANTPLPLGSVTAVTLTASDSHGNTASCSFTVTAVDRLKPSITCPPTQYIAVGANCSPALLPDMAGLATASDNCGQATVSHTAPSVGLSYPLGASSFVILTATDDAGNTATCLFTVTSSDLTPPTVVCQNISVNLNGTSVNITPEQVLNTGLSSDNCGTVNVQSVSRSSFNCMDIGTNVVTLTVNDGHGNTATCSATVNVNDITPPTAGCQNITLELSGNSVFITPAQVFNAALSSDNCGTVSPQSVSPNTFGFNTLGANTVILTVHDGHGNTASCTAIVQVNGSIAGRIIWKQDQSTGVKDATVVLSGSQNSSMTTAANGNYNFSLSNGGSFTITPSKNLNKMNGVNAQDVQRIQQHLSGNPISDPWQMLAADVNASNSITALDVNILQLAILGNPSALAQMLKSWRFVPTSYGLNNPPWGCPEQITVSATGANLDFYGVKVGDVAAAYANPTNTGALPLLLTAQDQLLQAGQVLTVDLHAGAMRDLNALQFALHFDPQQLQLSGVESLDALPLTNEHLGTWQASEGSLRVLWSDAQSRGLAAGAPLLRLRFTAPAGGARLSEVLQLDDAVLPGLVFTGAGASAGVTLRYDAATAVGLPVAAGLSLENYPNPFTGSTTIRFALPQACKAQLRIADATGRLLAEHNAEYSAGRHEQRFDLPVSAGVLYCELKTPFGVLVRKMVVAE